MTNVLPPSRLTRERLRRLIAMARTRTAPQTASADVADFDWSRPHHFRPEHLEAIAVFRRKTVDTITHTLDSLCAGPFTITAEPLQQHYASALASDLLACRQNDYLLPMSAPDEKHCGFLAFNVDAAARLVALMLRETRCVQASDRRLSTLEESILMDVAAAITDSFIQVMRQSGVALLKDRGFVKGAWPLSHEGFHDLACLPYRIRYPQGELELTFVLSSAVLEPTAGLPAGGKPLAQPEITNRIMRNLDKVPINLTARLCSAAIELDDVMNLRAGDVLLLPKKTSQPLELLLNDNKTFNAFPAAFCGKYAAVIAPPQAD